MAQWVKNLPAMQKTQEMWVPSLGQEDLLEEETATHSNILARESHGQRSLAGCSPKGCKESDTTEHSPSKCPPQGLHGQVQVWPVVCVKHPQECTAEPERSPRNSCAFPALRSCRHFTLSSRRAPRDNGKLLNLLISGNVRNVEENALPQRMPR